MAGRPRGADLRGAVRHITRASGTNFYYAFLTLPRARREAIFSVYAFCHAVDSAVDDAPNAERAHAALRYWREQLALAFTGRATDPIARSVGATALAFALPEGLFHEVVDGVARDLSRARFRTWDDLAGYCDLVAGAVGRLCVRIFGRADAEADEYARRLGAAMQLTNILRDLGPDAALGRFYLPLEDLERWRLGEADVLAGGPGPRLDLLAFEAGRARSFYDDAARFARAAGPAFTAAEVMRTIYQRLLDRIERAGFPVAATVVRVPRPEKIWLALITALRQRVVHRSVP